MCTFPCGSTSWLWRTSRPTKPRRSSESHPDSVHHPNLPHSCPECSEGQLWQQLQHLLWICKLGEIFCCDQRVFVHVITSWDANKRGMLRSKVTHRTYLLGNYIHLVRKELLSLIWVEPKLTCLWMTEFVLPGFSCTWSPSCSEGSTSFRKTVNCNRKTVNCNNNPSTGEKSFIQQRWHLRDGKCLYIVLTSPKLPLWWFFLAGASAAVSVGGGDNCQREKPVSQTHPSGDWQGH